MVHLSLSQRRSSSSLGDFLARSSTSRHPRAKKGSSSLSPSQQHKMPSLSMILIAFLLAPCEALVVGAAPRLNAVRSSIRLQDEPPPPPPSGGRLGGTVDQDGKSNVWVRATAGRGLWWHAI